MLNEYNLIEQIFKYNIPSKKAYEYFKKKKKKIFQ